MNTCTLLVSTGSGDSPGGNVTPPVNGQGVFLLQNKSRKENYVVAMMVLA